MGVAVCTAHMPTRPLEEVAHLALAAGYEGLDINADRFERGPPPHLRAPLDAAALMEARRALDGVSMRHSALSANIYLVAENTADAVSAKAHVAAVIDLAGQLGIPFVHVFTGRAPAAFSRAESLRRLADSLAQLCEMGGARGVQIGIEGCVPHFVRSAEEHLELFRMLPGSDLRVCLDPSHMFLHGESPVAAVETLFDRISLVHVKDAAGRYPEFTLPPLGQGEMDWKGLLGLLRSLGYDGDYAVEYEAANFGWREDDAAILNHGRDFLRENGL